MEGANLMLQMVLNKGAEDEEVMELVDTPEFILVQYCGMILRHRDIRIPQFHNMLSEIIGALKVIAEKEADGPGTYNRHVLKDYVKDIEELLIQFPPDESLIIKD
jgi:hypothetical protein